MKDDRVFHIEHCRDGKNIILDITFDTKQRAPMKDFAIGASIAFLFVVGGTLIFGFMFWVIYTLVQIPFCGV